MIKFIEIVRATELRTYISHIISAGNEQTDVHHAATFTLVLISAVSFPWSRFSFNLCVDGIVKVMCYKGWWQTTEFFLS